MRIIPAFPEVFVRLVQGTLTRSTGAATLLRCAHSDVCVFVHVCVRACVRVSMSMCGCVFFLLLLCECCACACVIFLSYEYVHKRAESGGSGRYITSVTLLLISQCVPCPDNSGTASTGSTSESKCECRAGWIQDKNVPSPACINIDECALDVDDCSSVATCADSAGSFICTCNTGYVGTGVECSGLCGDGRSMPEEDCDDGNTASLDGCSSQCTTEENFMCLGGNSTFRDTCVCASGFYPAPGVDSLVSTCALACSAAACSSVGTCQAQHGYCVCPRFYLGTACETFSQPPADRYGCRVISPLS